ncbi:hypothetical protein SpiGrapes_0849 [Sphaerochaeta pleomorpha str. Grapes]|uniref:Lipoprotein LPP20-like domain-containing protein n=1 Tax=Sphaerochaeta pleomorpha (strain ATCC BAA-1885 / DSM 22778 / Grapes) TaxID=158190 RepID=G8QQP5_SPHPG|nr:LPP20 family lipoprotein [Sphaerochaeta pleomorpha]AEV28676.1 hypothetical protein SpiGrapes_0849 [Sphaerochaeta pleomorpha str. Grapes]
MKKQNLSGKLLILCICVATVCSMSGCTSMQETGREPSWINQLYDRKYNEDTYLCAVGSGSSREKAVDAAFSSLSQVFNSKVRSVTTVSSLSTAATDAFGSVTFTDSSQMLDQGTVSSSTDKIIGAEVVNTYIDENARIYVRVALHRSRTADLYKNEIGELSSSINQLKLQSQTSADPLSAYFILRKAYGLAQRQQALIDQVEVLSKKKQTAALPSLERQLTTLASSIQVGVKVTVLSSVEPMKVTAAESLRSAFAQSLQSLGFKVVSDEKLATASLDILYTLEPVNLAGSPYEYARYELTAQLKEHDRLLLSYHKSDRQAALSSKDALAKALRQASGDSVQGFVNQMEQEFGSVED